MKILVTNDDGIYAKGIEVLKYTLEEWGADVTVVAPLEEKSGVSQCLTWQNPLKVKKIDRNGEFFGFGVEGTPVDCVKLAVNELLDFAPQAVISGINHGFNFGFHVDYSGTVAGALEGARQGIPSLAVSTGRRDQKDFTYAAQVAQAILDHWREWELDPPVILNLNVPPPPAKGMKLTRKSTQALKERYASNVSPFGENYFWLSGEFDHHQGDRTFDDAAVLEGYVSLTPLRLETTNFEHLDQLRDKISPREKSKIQGE